MEYINCDVCGSNSYTKVSQNTSHTINCGGSVFIKDTIDVVCDTCGQVYNNPMMTDDELSELYHSMSRNVTDAVKVDYAMLPIEEAQHMFIKECIDLPDGAKIFDIGCSLGGFLKLFVGDGFECVGCEPSISDAKVAVEQGIKVINRMFDPADYEPHSFDLIALRFVFEHLRQPSKMLTDLMGLLKPNGFIFIEVPNMAEPYVGLDSFFSFGHLYTFSKDTLAQIAKVNRYNIHAIAEVDNSHIPRRTFASLRMLITHGEKSEDIINYQENSLDLCARYLEKREKLITLIQQRFESIELDHFKSIIIYGAGTHTAELLNRFPFLKESCIGFVDGNKDFQGHPYFGKMVYSPGKLPTLSFDAIVISAREAEGEILQCLESVNLADRAIPIYKHIL